MVTCLTFGRAWLLRCYKAQALAIGWSKGWRGFWSDQRNHMESSLSWQRNQAQKCTFVDQTQITRDHLLLQLDAWLTAALGAPGQLPPAPFSPAGFGSEVPPDGPLASCSLIQRSSAGTHAGAQAPLSNPSNAHPHNLSLYTGHEPLYFSVLSLSFQLMGETRRKQLFLVRKQPK